MECRICGRESAATDLCRYHLMAYDNLRAGFERWKEAIEGLTWNDYIKQVHELEDTGRWIREAVNDIRSRDDL